MKHNQFFEETEEKPKSLIDRFWWVIPPVFIVFVFWPISQGYAFAGSWLKNIHQLFCFDEGSWIVLLFMFGFVEIGFIITKKMALKYKIIITTILGIIGLYVVGGFVALMIYYKEPF